MVDLDDVAIWTSTTKTFKQTFSTRIGPFIWLIYRLQWMWTNKIKKEKQYLKKWESYF